MKCLRPCLSVVRSRVPRWVLGGLLALGSTSALAEEACRKPEALPATLVDGATATAEQMRQSLVTLKEYMASGKAFQACLDGHPIADRRQEAWWDGMQNDMERAAALYNREVRRYNQRSDLAQGDKATSAAAAALR